MSPVPHGQGHTKAARAKERGKRSIGAASATETAAKTRGAEKGAVGVGAEACIGVVVAVGVKTHTNGAAKGAAGARAENNMYRPY